MTTESYAVEERYFRWLYSHIGSVHDLNPSHSHWKLAERLHQRIFEVTVKMDVNREGEGIDLRERFGDEEIPWGDSRYVFEPCSVLEMLIGLSIRANYHEDLDPDGDAGVGVWFWQMLENLGLAHISDKLYSSGPRMDSFIDSVIDRLIYRRYSPDGHGGLFPLEFPHEDQRGVELWYQLNAYLIERY